MDNAERKRKLWLPDRVYEALPWAYVLIGFAFLAGVAYLGDGDFFSGFYCALGLVSIVCGLVVLFIRSQLRARTGNTPAADS